MNIIENIKGFLRHRIKDPAARATREPLLDALRSEYAWTKVRNEYFADHPLCQVCHYNKDGQVHHKKPWHLFEDLRYEPTNLITLCQPCHFRLGHGRNWKKWNPEIQELSEGVQEWLDDIRDEG
ncbi:MAG: HNH endonuclease [Candidatus Cloacimonetes bacterium]|jgi:5-methylcytosine-specific restriction endonuclease McrA|nr:HNH endonuclease [Candidatus Cloacimonadota bacterium]